MKREVVRNKTWKYLVPILNSFSEDFKKNFLKLQIIQFGIHDTLLDGSTLSEGYNIYVLVDNCHTKLFKNVLNWFTSHQNFITEYNPTENIESKKRMLVFAIPEEFYNAYQKFLVGKYSEMYSKKDIEKLFTKRGEEIKGVLIRDPKFFDDYLKLLSKVFKIYIKNRTIYREHEFDLPPIIKEEVFNVISDKPVFFNEKLSRKFYSVKDFKTKIICRNE